MIRKIIFWGHLVAGLIAGLAIGIMCFTGTMLAFEKELTAWAERDARQTAPHASDAPRLTLDEMQRHLREAQPEASPASIVLQNDPDVAVAFSIGRVGAFYVDPYSNEIRQPKSTAMADFMRQMTEWHRFLGFRGEASRPRGKLVNGICNIAFCALAVTGLFLWIPRQWSWRALRPVVWFRQNSSPKARDFNWHNVIGFWCAPILIVLTLTALPISFRWASNAIFTLTGTEPLVPGAAGPGAAVGPGIEIPAPPPGTHPLGNDALLAIAQKEIPAWKTITLRLSGAGRPGSAGLRPASPEGGRDARAPMEAAATTVADAGVPREGGRNNAVRAGGSRNPQPVTFTIREAGAWPRTATTTLVLNPFTGEVLRRSGYGEQNAAQQVRSWTRFLHTGEALGSGGQLVAGLACLGGCFLVYTGFALSWRRFFGKKLAGVS